MESKKRGRPKKSKDTQIPPSFQTHFTINQYPTQKITIDTLKPNTSIVQSPIQDISIQNTTYVNGEEKENQIHEPIISESDVTTKKVGRPINPNSKNQQKKKKKEITHQLKEKQVAVSF